MRRRNKPRVVWLPQTDANSIGAAGQDSSLVYQLFTVSVAGASGQTVTQEIPLVLDAQQDIGNADSSLSDIESSGYRLRRVVGKIFVQAAQSSRVTPTFGPQSVLVTAGIIVRLANTTTGESMAKLVGGADFNPALIENTGDPWVWRRTWIVGNENQGDNLENLGTTGTITLRIPTNPVPTSNYLLLAGGVSDGPHVDQKTARIIGPEHRLFLDVSSTVLGEAASQPDTLPLTIAVFTDLRVLGSLRTSVGNRRNASR